MNQANLIQQQYHQLQQNVMNQELDQLKQINMMNNTHQSNIGNDSSSAVLYIKAPAGKLNLKVNFFPNQEGAVITAIYESCTFKHQINVGDRIVTINGYHKVAKFEDLSIGINEPVRIIGIMRGGVQEGGKKQGKGIKRKITEPTLASIPNVPPKPMRPLTAYHIFFQLEREYLIQTDTSAAADAADTDKEEEKKDSPAKAKRQSKNSDIAPTEYYKGTLPTKYKDIKLSHDWYYAPGKRRKRAHRKVSHGFSFLELSKTIIEKWKALDTSSDDTDGIKEFVTKLAKEELEDYKIEISKWRELYGDDKKKKKKKKTKKEKKEEERKAKEDAEKKATLVKVVNGEAYYVQAPAGKLGLAVKFVNDGTQGAVITAIYEACAFKGQVKVGDRIVMINGYHAVNSLIDLSVGMNEPIRILGNITKGEAWGERL